ncbi:MAG: acylphosphatase [Spirochaetes bacterium]|nr:acylphosphatase [Spirochaetota bacterium]
MNKHVKIRVKGIVQGVGFRPFIYRLAAKNNLKGTVQNDTEGVLIFVEGPDAGINSFI